LEASAGPYGESSRLSAASRYLTGLLTGRRAHISHICKTPPPLAGAGHNGFGSVDALREEIEGRHPRVSWVSHVHGPYPYPVIRGGRSNRSFLEGCRTPPCVNRQDSRARGSGDLADSEIAASDGSPRTCHSNPSSRDAHILRVWPSLPTIALRHPPWRSQRRFCS
jgi:hypothetical protein